MLSGQDFNKLSTGRKVASTVSIVAGFVVMGMALFKRDLDINDPVVIAAGVLFAFGVLNVIFGICSDIKQAYIQPVGKNHEQKVK